MKLEEAVRASLRELKPDKRDWGTARLAVAYAQAVDSGADLDKTGPLLLACLESLLMTPKARAAAVKGANDVPAKSPLDDLRERRAARASRATTVDSAAT